MTQIKYLFLILFLCSLAFARRTHRHRLSSHRSDPIMNVLNSNPPVVSNILTYINFTYDLNAASIESSKTVVVAAMEVNNTSLQTIEKAFSLQGSRIFSRMWKTNATVDLPIYFSATFDVPALNSTTLTTQPEPYFASDFDFNTELNFESTFTSPLETVDLPSCSVYNYTLQLNIENASVPFTATLTYWNGSTANISGTWIGEAHSAATFVEEVITAENTKCQPKSSLKEKVTQYSV